MTSPGPSPRLAITSCALPPGLRTTSSLFSRSATTALPPEEPADVDGLELVVARIGSVAVHRLLRDGERRLDLGHVRVFDDLDAGAVRDPAGSR